MMRQNHRYHLIIRDGWFQEARRLAKGTRTLAQHRSHVQAHSR